MAVSLIWDAPVADGKFVALIPVHLVLERFEGRLTLAPGSVLVLNNEDGPSPIDKSSQLADVWAVTGGSAAPTMNRFFSTDERSRDQYADAPCMSRNGIQNYASREAYRSDWNNRIYDFAHRVQAACDRVNWQFLINNFDRCGAAK